MLNCRQIYCRHRALCTLAPADGTEFASTFSLFDFEQLREERDTTWVHDREMVAEMRSNHAGETGAVSIYRGARSAISLRPHAFPVDAACPARDFTERHIYTERSHLALFDALLPAEHHSRLLPLWRLAGFTLGFVPTFFGGPRWLFITVEAVETFVEDHFQAQIVPLTSSDDFGPDSELVKLLAYCCEDEVHHKEEAASHAGLAATDRPLAVRVWSMIVGGGSAAAVALARRV